MAERHDDFAVDAVREESSTKIIPTDFDPSEYEFEESFKPSSDPRSIHSTPELIALLEKDKNVEIDARVIGFSEGTATTRKLNKKQFLEACKSEPKIRLKESGDSFLIDNDSGNGLIGQDFIPLLGGPFYKQNYPRDYIQQHNLAFHAYNHDPIARLYVSTMRDFTLGRGYSIDFFHTDVKKERVAKAAWSAFEEVNDLQKQMEYVARELCIYGETMIWKLPDNNTKIVWQTPAEQMPAKGLIPRVRVMDPSNFWEIITMPEDINRPLAYQWVAPTQYQTYTTELGGTQVPSSKFIFQQIPADQIFHYKVNAVSNEKRGRSDLYPVLGYLKRLRDSINYRLIADLKNAAYAWDTTIEGSQQDIDSYVEAQQSLGTIHSAGSEFVHTSKVKREIIAAAGTRGGQSESFEWNLSMICAGLGLPVSYVGSHLSGGQTRASALVATEPVTKKFEMRQMEHERILRDLINWYLKKIGLDDVEFEISFPSLITQDRSMTLKDLALAVEMKWISQKRAATIAAKELNITQFDYDKELEEMDQSPAPETDIEMNPLTGKPKLDTGLDLSLGAAPKQDSAVTSDERKALKDNNGF